MKKFSILIIIFFITIFFRIYGLSTIPPHPSLDEVSIGYNAYSILKTGADEYGTRLPILLRAYDDWRPALYMYLVTPFVKIFGLNILAVRLPSVLLSIATVIATYFLTRELFKNVKLKLEIARLPARQGNLKLEIPEVVMLLLAVSPWHIYISRLGHEVNAAFAFFIFGLLFFFKAINSNTTAYRSNRYILFLSLSALFFGFSFDAYQTTKVVTPLILLVLLILFRKELFNNKKALVLSFLVGLIVVLPVLIELTKPQGLIRFQGVNLFSSNPEVFQKSAEQLVKDQEEDNRLGLILHNRRVVHARLFLQAYTSHFNLEWLFTNKGDEQFKIPGFGLFYTIELPLLVFGIFMLIKSSISIRIKTLLVIWVLVGILPAAITTGYPHAMRVYNVIPVPYIFIALGIASILKISLRLNRLKLPILILLAVVSAYGASALLFYRGYFTDFPRSLSYQFQYGILGALSYVKEIEGSYEKVIVSNQKNLFQSYMFYLYSSKYDPLLYQKEGGTKSGGFAEEHMIGKYEFRNLAEFIKKDDTVDRRKVLLVMDPSEINTDSIRILKVFRFLNGKDAVLVAEKE